MLFIFELDDAEAAAAEVEAAAADHPEGYDPDQFVHKEAIVALGFCTICQCIARDAVVSSGGSPVCEAHVFCQACIRQWPHPTCPNCKEFPGRYIDAPYHNREIKNALVSCSYCLEHVVLKRQAEHELNCQARPRPCLQCDELVLPSADHQSTCPGRLVPCDACDGPVPFNQQDQHRDTCPATWVVCGHPECGESVTRSALDAHMAACDWARVACPFESVGCTERLLRSDTEHVHSTSHMLLLLHKINSIGSSASDANPDSGVSADSAGSASSAGSAISAVSELRFLDEVHVQHHAHAFRPVRAQAEATMCHECYQYNTDERWACIYDPTLYLCRACLVRNRRLDPLPVHLRRELLRRAVQQVLMILTGDAVTTRHAMYHEILGIRVTSRALPVQVNLGVFGTVTQPRRTRRGTITEAGPSGEWLRVRWDDDIQEDLFPTECIYDMYFM